MAHLVKRRSNIFKRLITALRERGVIGTARMARSLVSNRYEMLRLPLIMRRMVPPPRLQYYSINYVLLGRSLARLVVDPGGLQPDDRMLEVGSGIGRVAMHLTQHLSPQGSYNGFDTVPFAVEWCRERITSAYPRFRFDHVDVHNAQYNPNGKRDPLTFAFPYPDAAFDFVACIFVMCWLPPADLDHYLSEMARVLRPGGRCWINGYLLNEDSLDGIARGVSEQKVGADRGGWRAMEETMFAYDEAPFLDLVADKGFDVAGVYYGSWCGRQQYLDRTDTILLTRRA